MIERGVDAAITSFVKTFGGTKLNAAKTILHNRHTECKHLPPFCIPDIEFHMYLLQERQRLSWKRLYARELAAAQKERG